MNIFIPGKYCSESNYTDILKVLVVFHGENNQGIITQELKIQETFVRQRRSGELNKYSTNQIGIILDFYKWLEVERIQLQYLI